MKLIITLLFTAVTVMAQQATPAQPAPLEGLELKGYERAMAEVKKEKEKAEADKNKAEADAEAKRRASIVTYSPVDIATQNLLRERSKAAVKESEKLLRERQQHTAAIQAIDRRLQELEQQAAAVVKVKNE
jgi:hypothetical protein